MALNSLEYAQKFASELDKIVVQKAVTGFFADNVLKAQFVGAKTVLIPDIDFVGLGDYDRDNGFPQGKITVANTSYQLSKDRGRELQLDRMDMDETGIAGLAGQTLKEFVRTQVVPEMDAYNLSKLAGVAKTQNNTATFTAENVYKIFTEGTQKVQDKAGYDAELVCFADSEAYAALMNTPEISRSVTVSDFKQGEIDLKVKKLNDVVIIPVASDRMKTAYTFNAGASSTAGGYAPTGDAENINLLILPKDAASLVKKTEQMRIFTPEQNQEADAYLFQYRLYYDIFVKKSNLGSIFAATSV
jgi:hypothetical protein